MQVPVLIFVVLAIFSSATADPGSTQRVPSRPPVGGQTRGVEEAYPGERPFQVSIQDFEYGSPYHLCGGAIYSTDTIITSAACVYGDPPPQLQIVAGDYNLTQQEGTEQIIEVSQIIPHPDLNIYTFSNDIALLKLSSPLSFTDYVQAIALPPDNYVATGECTISGWGSANIDDGNNNMSDTLQKDTIPILTTADCNQFLAILGLVDLENVVCGGYQESGKKACIGDDGGPLTCLHNGLRYLTGVLSFDIGCNFDNVPGVYVSTEHYIQWIEEN